MTGLHGIGQEWPRNRCADNSGAPHLFSKRRDGTVIDQSGGRATMDTIRQLARLMVAISGP